jgi:hypothetical protein
LYLFSIFVSFTTFTYLVSICSNLSLSESKNQNYTNKIELADIIALVLILCLCIAFGLFFPLRPDRESYFNKNPHLSQNGETKAHKDFDIVPRSLLPKVSANSNKPHYSYSAVEMAQAVNPAPPNHSARVAVLAING